MLNVDKNRGVKKYQAHDIYTASLNVYKGVHGVGEIGMVGLIKII